MKQSDSGDFCVFYVEPDDEKAPLFQRILEQKKPVVLVLAEQVHVFQRPEDFAELKHIRRHLDVPVLFVAAGSERLVHLAGRHGFPIYLSMDALVNALKVGQVGRPRGAVRKTIPLTDVLNQAAAQSELLVGKTTATLNHAPHERSEETSISRKTSPLLAETWGMYEHHGNIGGQNGYATRRDGQATRPMGSGEHINNNRQSGYPKRTSTSPDTTTMSTSWQNGPYGQVPGRDRQVQEKNGFSNRASTLPQDFPQTEGLNVPRVTSDIDSTHRGGMYKPASHSYNPVSHSHNTSYQTVADRPLARPAVKDVPTPPTLPVLTEPPAQGGSPRVNRVAAGVLILLLITLITAGLGYFLVVSHNTLPTDAPAMTNVVVGHVTFMSSNQLSENSNQGLNDKVLVTLDTIPQVDAGKNYYAWLLGDKSQSDMQAILLGEMPVVDGHAQVLYPGDAKHTNLLGMASRFLVTEEFAGAAPLTPSPDYSTWRYYGEVSQTPINAPDNTQHFSYLDHLRHLLAADPTLDELELPGGLNTWLYRNTSKILEWTGSTRDQWQESKDVGFVRRQTLRTLTYLDGVSFVGLDLPPKTSLNVNERLARIGLLDVNGPTQDPSGYLDHISHHLYGLLQSSAMTPALRTKIAAVVTSLDNVKTWLEQVRHDALQIIKMSDTQLRQPATLTLLNDMIDNATKAFSGQADPVSGQMQQGVTWMHDQLQALATLDVKHITAADGRNVIGPLQMVPNKNVQRASVSGGKI